MCGGANQKNHTKISNQPYQTKMIRHCGYDKTAPATVCVKNTLKHEFFQY